MAMKHFKEVTIKLGIWEDLPLYTLTDEDWRDWVAAIVRTNLLDYTRGQTPHYSVIVDTFGPYEEGEL